MSAAPWTHATVVAAIQAFHARTGRWPISNDFRRRHGLPSVSLVYRLWGGLEPARQAAGMPAGALPTKGERFAQTWAGARPWPQGRQTPEGEEP